MTRDPYKNTSELFAVQVFTSKLLLIIIGFVVLSFYKP